MRIAQPLFPNDDGLADSHLIAALSDGDRYQIVDALSRARVFVALLAELESASTTEAGVKIEQESAMSLTWLVDGSTKALPIFSSIATLTAWNPAARPLGVEAERAAIVALADGGIAVLDPGSQAPYEVGVIALRALALGYEYLPLSDDPEVAKAIAEALEVALGQGHLVEFTIEAKIDSRDLVITLLSPRPIPAEEQLSNFATQLAADERILLRLEGELEIQFALR
ncbi:hypothetical protein GALL_454440 [mine drainage metagenome]|uniref:SseB protein N-terminal domain-containing protein n=1 Tax=mine drainage metagenome TaxID=410659 RepID=A0A1J5QAC7_9ZZZZ